MTDVLRALREQLQTAAWCTQDPPEPPATAAELESAERRLGRALPPLLAATLQVSRRWSWRGVDEDVMWMPPDELALGARAFEQGVDWEIDDAADGVEPLYDSPQRLTFAYSDARVFQIDLMPAAGGRVGQIVAYDPEEGRVDLVAASLADFLVEGVRCLREVAIAPDDVAPTDSDSGSAALAEAKRLQEMFAVLDAAAGDPEAMRQALAALGGGSVAAAADNDDDDDELAPLPADSAASAALADAAQAFVAAVDGAAPALRKRLKAPLSAAKARAYLAAERKAGVVPEPLLPLFAAFDGQKGDAALLPCPAGLCSGLSWLSLEGVCDSHGNEYGLRHLYGRLPVPPVPGVHTDFWNPRWIPLLRSPLNDSAGGVGVLFADFDPAPGGQPGQLVLTVMRFPAGGATIERRRIADGLSDWLRQQAQQIADGRFVAGAKGFRPPG